MLDKLAELVREQIITSKDTYGIIPCTACDYGPLYHCQDKEEPCPNMGELEGALMLARWAVLLVAQALEAQAQRALKAYDEYSTFTFEQFKENGRTGFDERAVELWEARCLLGKDLADLIAEASTNGCKSEKQAEEVAE